MINHFASEERSAYNSCVIFIPGNSLREPEYCLIKFCSI